MEEDTKMEETIERKQYGLDLLLLVKSAQNQNGLRNNDYGRYHKYCIRKIYRMRKALNFTQGRKEFI